MSSLRELVDRIPHQKTYLSVGDMKLICVPDGNKQ